MDGGCPTCGAPLCLTCGGCDLCGTCDCAQGDDTFDDGDTDIEDVEDIG